MTSPYSSHFDCGGYTKLGQAIGAAPTREEYHWIGLSIIFPVIRIIPEDGPKVATK